MEGGYILVILSLLTAQATSNGNTKCEPVNNGQVIKDLQSQMASLQANLQSLKEEHLKPVKPEFYISFCAPTNDVKTLDFYILNAEGGNSKDHVCQALSSNDSTSGIYDISVSLYNDKGRGTTDVGHPGVIFNAVDTLNYDFVYFRPHSSSSCYQTGYMSNGKPTFVKSSYCSHGLFPKRSWTNIKILVRTKMAYVFMKNKMVDIMKTHYNPLNRGGALAFRGYENVVFFNDYLISNPAVVPSLSSSRVQSCSAGTGWVDSSTLILSAIGRTWAAANFCRVQLSVGLSGSVSRYQFEAQLYNIRSKNGATLGHPGVMYNVQDMNNYDFVYFRPHSARSCYQTGYARNGAITMISSSSCDGGPPRSQTWFTVNIKVHSNRNVQVFMNGKHVKTLVPHHRLTPRVGVIVGNGYDNIIQARSFKIKNI